MRHPFDVAWSPEASSITPAFSSSMLNFPIAVRIFSSGRTPASESLLALTSTMTRIAVCSSFWVLPTRRARGGEIDGGGLPAGDGPEDEEGLRPLDHGGGQRRVR